MTSLYRDEKDRMRDLEVAYASTQYCALIRDDGCLVLHRMSERFSGMAQSEQTAAMARLSIDKVMQLSDGERVAIERRRLCAARHAARIEVRVWRQVVHTTHLLAFSLLPNFIYRRFDSSVDGSVISGFLRIFLLMTRHGAK